MRITALVTTAGLLLAGCAVHEPIAPEVRVDHLPPENLDIIEALVRSGDIPLSVHPLCEELAGPNAKTIGDYTAQLLAMQVEGGTNDVGPGPATAMWRDFGKPMSFTLPAGRMSETTGASGSSSARATAWSCRTASAASCPPGIEH
jgi:hypothetical protein